MALHKHGVARSHRRIGKADGLTPTANQSASKKPKTGKKTASQSQRSKMVGVRTRAVRSS